MIETPGQELQRKLWSVFRGIYESEHTINRSKSWSWQRHDTATLVVRAWLPPSSPTTVALVIVEAPEAKVRGGRGREQQDLHIENARQSPSPPLARSSRWCQCITLSHAFWHKLERSKVCIHERASVAKMRVVICAWRGCPVEERQRRTKRRKHINLSLGVPVNFGVQTSNFFCFLKAEDLNLYD